MAPIHLYHVSGHAYKCSKFRCKIVKKTLPYEPDEITTTCRLWRIGIKTCIGSRWTNSSFIRNGLTCRLFPSETGILRKHRGSDVTGMRREVDEINEIDCNSLSCIYSVVLILFTCLRFTVSLYALSLSPSLSLCLSVCLSLCWSVGVLSLLSNYCYV